MHCPSFKHHNCRRRKCKQEFLEDDEQRTKRIQTNGGHCSEVRWGKHFMKLVFYFFIFFLQTTLRSSFFTLNRNDCIFPVQHILACLCLTCTPGLTGVRGYIWGKQTVWPYTAWGCCTTMEGLGWPWGRGGVGVLAGLGWSGGKQTNKDVKK